VNIDVSLRISSPFMKDSLSTLLEGRRGKLHCTRTREAAYAS